MKVAPFLGKSDSRAEPPPTSCALADFSRAVAACAWPEACHECRMSPRRPLWLIFAPAIFLLLWSGGFAVAKIGLNHAEPLTLLALRYVILVVLMLPLAVILRVPMPATWRGWADVAVVGFMIQVVYFVACYVAFKSGVSAGGVAIIVCLQPILVALIAPRLVGERVSHWGWVGLALGMAGAGIVINARGAIAVQNSFGLMCTVIGLLGITAGTLWEKRFGVSHHPVAANLIQYAVGAVVTVPLAYATEGMVIRWDGEFVAVMAYLVIGNSIIALGLLLAMIRVGEVSRVSVLFYLVPPLSALIAWPLLGEQLAPMAWLGMAIAAVGVALVSRKARLPAA